MFNKIRNVWCLAGVIHYSSNHIYNVCSNFRSNGIHCVFLCYICCRKAWFKACFLHSSIWAKIKEERAALSSMWLLQQVWSTYFCTFRVTTIYIVESAFKIVSLLLRTLLGVVRPRAQSMVKTVHFVVQSQVISNDL